MRHDVSITTQRVWFRLGGAGGQYRTSEMTDDRESEKDIERHTVTDCSTKWVQV